MPIEDHSIEYIRVLLLSRIENPSTEEREATPIPTSRVQAKVKPMRYAILKYMSVLFVMSMLLVGREAIALPDLLRGVAKILATELAQVADAREPVALDDIL